MICACNNCSCVVSSFGLCEKHLNESVKAKKEKQYKKWCTDHNVSFLGNTFKNCGFCKVRFCKICKLPFKGNRHRICPSCIYNYNKEKWTKQNEKRRKLHNILDKREDSDPNFKNYLHKGPPLRVSWACEFLGCVHQFDIVLLEGKTKYPRFCFPHRGKI